uniref:Acyltransferase n=1 Tax=Aceria tosichella TaxID=561515 RepID=A0A6G1S6R5_9ACAR
MAQSSTTNKRKNNNKNDDDNNNNNNDDNKSNGNRRKYLEIEPPVRENLSPALIYTCTVLYSLLPLASLVAFLTLVCLLFTKYWFITITYYSFLIFDAKTCNRGGRRWPSVYRARFWSYLAAYFPIKLRHSDTFKLDPNENYILNYHPHGIAAFGCVTTFATNGLNFSRLFPGIRSLFMVHETSFLVPIMRETFSLRGDCSVNSKSFDYILEKRWQMADGGGGARSLSRKQMDEARGNLLALCGGGLAEADLTDMETLRIVCANRKGFVKKSLIHGAHLIPCIAFGENSVFKKVNFKPGSLLYRLEKIWYQLFRFKHPIYFGHSLFFGNKGRGPVPYKRPITVVMGDPIHVDRVEQPSQEQIDELHAKYIARLKSMYEDNRTQLCNQFDTKLELV